jgi:hypothetical protein
MNIETVTEPAHNAEEITMIVAPVARAFLRPNRSAHQELKTAPKNPPA